MIKNLNLTLLNGGKYRCGPHWDKIASTHENCYKLYLPIAGQATLNIGGKTEIVEAGRAYFISEPSLDSQSCPDFMDVYWIHFIPDSLELRYLLTKSAPFYSWPIDTINWAIPFLRQLDKLFQEGSTPEEMTLKEHPADLTCSVHGILSFLIGDLLNKTLAKNSDSFSAAVQKMDKAIAYMDKNFLYSPSLEEIARQSHLSPNYFHRLFKKQFKLTPYDYILNRRMAVAQRLLTSTRMSIKEIARDAGYGNEFHFSRTFKKQFKISPSDYRINGGSV